MRSIKLEERAIAIPVADGLALDGIFRAAPGREDAGGLVVAAPHPLYGGSMDSPVVAEIAWSGHKAGLASLRFNWRGVGASSGATSGDPGDADADFAAALGYLAETVHGPLVAAGYSFGAAAAARAAAREPRVKRLVLVAPPPGLLGTSALAGFERPILILSGSRDDLAPAEVLAKLAEGRPGAHFVAIAGADHFYGSGLATLGAEIATWLGAD